MKALIQRILVLSLLTLLNVRLLIATESPVNLLVKWREGPACEKARQANQVFGATVIQNFHALGWQWVQLQPGRSAEAGIEGYRSLDSVLAAEPFPSRAAMVRNDLEPAQSPDDPPVPSEAPQSSRPSAGLHRVLSPDGSPVTPDDPRFKEQWSLRKIGAPEAWMTTTGSTNIVVAVIDGGVDYTHPDLAANMWINPGEAGLDAAGRDKATNGIDDDANGYVDDVHGIDGVTGSGDPMDTGRNHGTQVAGVVGAVGNNQIGVAGLSWSTRIMAIKDGGDDETAPDWADQAWLAGFRGLDYMVEMKRRGVNVRVAVHSYGGYVDSFALRDAYEIAGRAGILHVAAALNLGADQDPFAVLPGGLDLPAVINVANSTETDTLRSTSNFGRSTVHLAAPGVNILTTGPGARYDIVGGTSFSCPLVASAAALLLSAKPELSLLELRAALFGSVDPGTAFRGKVMTHGRLNIARALAYLTNTEPPAIVLHMTPAGPLARHDAPVQMTFNRPMNRASVEAAFRITPSVDGSFQWSDDSRSFTFTHDQPFASGIVYSATLAGTALDEAGRSLDGDFDRTSEGDGADAFIWRFSVPVANDAFAGAQLLQGASGSVSGNNRYAYLELNEPRAQLGPWREYGMSLWYRWTPPAEGGWFTFDLTAAGFDTLLGIWTGDRVDRLAWVTGNDNHGTRRNGRVSFEAKAGTNYAIVVAGKSEFDPALAGAYTLSWFPTPAPAFTGAQISPASAAAGARVTLTGSNFTGARAVLFNGASESASFASAPTNNLDLRITATVPPDATSGPITIVTPHGNVTSSVNFSVLPPPLQIRALATESVVVTWGSTSPEFGLESANAVTGSPWIPVNAAVKTGPDGSTVSLGVTGTSRFLRLRKPAP